MTKLGQTGLNVSTGRFVMALLLMLGLINGGIGAQRALACDDANGDGICNNGEMGNSSDWIGTNGGTWTGIRDDHAPDENGNSWYRDQVATTNGSTIEFWSYETSPGHFIDGGCVLTDANGHSTQYDSDGHVMSEWG